MVWYKCRQKLDTHLFDTGPTNITQDEIKAKYIITRLFVSFQKIWS